MSSGILSTAASLAGLRVLPDVLLALAALAWAVLAAQVLTRLLTDRRGWLADARTPGSLTGVAATAVIGGRVAALGWTRLAEGLLGLAAVACLVLLPLVLRHLHGRVTGSAFLLCVAPEGLAALAGTLGGATCSPAAVVAGTVVCALGAVLYAGVLARFDRRQLAVGAGDHWVVAGARAIPSLAGAQLLTAADRLHLPGGTRPALRWLDLAVWAVAAAGYAVLVVCEVRWPRPRYDVRRWATVFPMGMTAAAAFAVADAERLPALTAAGHALLWPALLAWALTAAGAARRRLPRRDAGAPSGRVSP
jgi:tellurite resistance protein TehA-like permease